jgi:Zn-dependent M16 (insulinase) family peptidase
VKVRFSEHESKNDDSDIEDWVNFTGKTFNQAAEEMKYKINNYIIDLRSKEKQYLKKLDKQNKKKRR